MKTKKKPVKNPGWIPVRKGGIYCSPRCGGDCKHADWRKARDESSALAKVLGPGWKPRVWENLGWHWEVNFSKGRLSVCRPYLGSDNYHVDFQKEFPIRSGVTGTMQISASHKDPRRALKKLLEKLEGFALDMMDAAHEAHSSLNQS